CRIAGPCIGASPCIGLGTNAVAHKQLASARATSRGFGITVLRVGLAFASATLLTLRRQELAEELRQHLAPRHPVVAPILAPCVDAIRNALRTEHLLDVPALRRLFVGTLTVRQQDEALT